MDTNTAARPLILVIDADPLVREQQCGLLMHAGCEVWHVSDAETGIKKAVIARPDVIVLELLLPDHHGLDVCRRLKSIAVTSEIPVLFMTSSAALTDKIEAFAAGAVDYLVKPLAPEELLARINVHVTIQRTRQALHQSESRYRTLVDHSIQGVLVLQHDRIVFANQSAVTITGYSTAELLAMSAAEVDNLIHPDDRARVQRYKTMHQVGEYVPQRYEFRSIRKDGAVRWLESFATPIRYHDQHAIQLTYLDMTERREAEARVLQMNQHLARTAADLEILNRMSHALQRADTRQAAIDTSLPLLRELFSEQAGTLYLRQPQSDMLEQIAIWGDPSTPFAGQTCGLCKEAGGTEICICGGVALNGCNAGDCSCQEVFCCCVPLVNTEGLMIGALQMHRPAQVPAPAREHTDWLASMVADLFGLAFANIELREQLREQTLRDPLTGLFNRRFLDEALQREFHQAARYQRPIGLIMMDIDYFKQINDTHGHHAGDDVLRALAAYLQQRIRRGDIACRYGGEELLLVLPGASLNFTRDRASAICNEVRQLHLVADWRDVMPPISISIGVAAFPNHGLTPSALIDAADTALYQAKNQGRNQVCVANAL